MSEIASLTGQLGQSRLALLEVLMRVPDDAWDTQDWAVREVLAHIAAWDDIAAATVKALSDGQPTPPMVVDEDAFNANAARTFTNLSAPQVVIHVHAARARLVAAVSGAGDLGEFPLPWGGSGGLARLVTGLVKHEREHAAKLATRSQQ